MTHVSGCSVKRCVLPSAAAPEHEISGLVVLAGCGAQLDGCATDLAGHAHEILAL